MYSCAFLSGYAGTDPKKCIPSTSYPVTDEAPSRPQVAFAPIGVQHPIFEDKQWNRLRGVRRSYPGWHVVNENGVSSIATIEVIFVSDHIEVGRWCGGDHVACGCARSGPPWRIAVIGVPEPRVCALQPDAILAHELWHLKGYYGHTPDGLWPRDRRTGRVAPNRGVTASD